MHQLRQIQFPQPLDLSIEVFVYEIVNGVIEKFASKIDYQRSVVKQLVSELLDAPITIAHKDSGAPFIAEFPNKKLSVSHSGDYYAVQFSDSQNVGVDIQLFKDNLSKARDYFVNKEEENDLEMTELNLHLIWSAKEAVYKLLEGEVSDFKKAMRVIEIGETEILVSCGKKNYTLFYEVTDDFVLVYS